MVSQVPVVGILMIVNGSLAGILGLGLAFMGPFIFSIAAMEGRPGGMRPDEKSVVTLISIVYLVIGLLVLTAGALNIIAGIRALSYRGRGFVLTALFFNILPLFTCYCSPTSLALMIYGLIVMFQQDVAKAFAMGDEGVPAQSIKLRFAPGPVRYERDDDYYEMREESRSLPPPQPRDKDAP